MAKQNDQIHTFRLNKEIWTQARIKSIKNNTNMTDVIERLIVDYISEPELEESK